MKYAFFFLLIIVSVGRSFADNSDSTRNAKIHHSAFDSSFVGRFADHITLKLSGSTDRGNLRIKNGRAHPKYAPNSPFKIGISISYHWLSLSLSVKLPSAEDDNDIHGNTEAFDLGFSTYGRWLALEGYIQAYSGFYLRNPQNFYPSWDKGEPYPQRRDLSIVSVGINFMFISNSTRYSIRAATTQSEMQLKSAGSFIVMPYFNFLQITSTHSLVPGSQTSVVPIREQLTQGLFSNLGVLMGYGYTYCYKRFYASPVLLAGLSVEGQSFSTLGGYILASHIILKPKFHLSVGYNIENFFGGITYDYENTNIPITNTLYQYKTKQLRLFVGMRFKTNRHPRSKH